MRDFHAFCVKITLSQPALVYISFANHLLTYHNRSARVVLKEYNYELDHFRLLAVLHASNHIRKRQTSGSSLHS